MTTDDTRRPLQGTVDFTFMYAAHDAFRRDLRRLAAVKADRTAGPAVRVGWATLKNQLHVHHTAEDEWLWPDVTLTPDPRSAVTSPTSHYFCSPRSALGPASVAPTRSATWPATDTPSSPRSASAEPGIIAA